MRLLVLAVAVIASLVTTAAAAADKMTPGERQRLLAHLDMTESWLVSELESLSTEQLTFKMTPESWSITDVVEHLAIAEPQYWQKLQESMKLPATTVKTEATDAGILWYGVDRTNRAAPAKRACRTDGSTRSAGARVVPQAADDDARDPKTTKDELRGPDAEGTATWTSTSGI